jgi:hypothetical protein
MRCGVAPHGRQGRAVLAMDARGAISRIHASERTAGSESIPGAAHQAEVAMHVPRVIPSVTRWPRLHARRLSLSRSSSRLSRSGVWLLSNLIVALRIAPEVVEVEKETAAARTKQELTDQAV